MFVYYVSGASPGCGRVEVEVVIFGVPLKLGDADNEWTIPLTLERSEHSSHNRGGRFGAVEEFIHDATSDGGENRGQR